jgi:RHS repeat-associated protein
VDFAYNAASQFDTITRYADLAGTDLVATTTFGYETGIGRLESIAHAKGMTTLASYNYTYDLAGRFDEIDSLLDGLTTYSHDNRGQLTAANHATQTDEAYTYDDNGNRTLTGYTIGDNNLTLSDGVYNYTYDDEGNRLSRTQIASGEQQEYTWDHRNRLVEVVTKDATDTVTKKVAYEYDAFDRRVHKRVDETGNGTWDRGEQYVYDGEHIALVFDDDGDLLRRNLHGNAIDQILASEFLDTNETNWYLTDHLGTVRDVYSYDDVLNDLVSEGHIEYDSFGNIVDGAAAAEEAHFAYTGREWDADAELFYYRHRWYDAKLGQFISQDPIGFLAEDPNLRRYVGNDVLVNTDPSGLQSVVGLPVQWAATLTRLSAPVTLGIQRLQQAQMQLAQAYNNPCNVQAIQRAQQLLLQRRNELAIAQERLMLAHKDIIEQMASRGVANTPALQSAITNSSILTSRAQLLIGHADRFRLYDATQMNHIFGKPGHNLEGVIKSCGNVTSAMDRLTQSIQSLYDRGAITATDLANGVPIDINGDVVTVTGRVVDGATKIGTAYIP